jgi:hypothetical protein
MGDENAAGEPLVQLGRELGEARRLRQHLARDAGERLDLGRYRDAGIDERRPFGHHFEALDLQHADLGDAVGRRPRAGRLQVDDRERRRVQVHRFSYRSGYISSMLAHRWGEELPGALQREHRRILAV